MTANTFFVFKFAPTAKDKKKHDIASQIFQKRGKNVARVTLMHRLPWAEAQRPRVVRGLLSAQKYFFICSRLQH